VVKRLWRTPLLNLLARILVGSLGVGCSPDVSYDGELRVTGSAAVASLQTVLVEVPESDLVVIQQGNRFELAGATGEALAMMTVEELSPFLRASRNTLSVARNELNGDVWISLPGATIRLNERDPTKIDACLHSVTERTTLFGEHFRFLRPIEHSSVSATWITEMFDERPVSIEFFDKNAG